MMLEAVAAVVIQEIERKALCHVAKAPERS